MSRPMRLLALAGVILLGVLTAPPVLGVDSAGSHDGDAAALTPAEAVAESILFTIVDIGIVLLVLSFALCLFRIIRGPTLIDRGIATDTITMHVVGIAILLTISLRTLLYFDAVLIFAILGFATTIAFAQFIGRRRAV